MRPLAGDAAHSLGPLAFPALDRGRTQFRSLRGDPDPDLRAPVGAVLMVWGAFAVPGRRVGDYGVSPAELGNREFWVAIDHWR
jgi:hypothetical protein